MTIKQTIFSNYPDLFSDNQQSFLGDYRIRFDLGCGLKSGTKKRVKNVVERACEIFKQTMSDEILLIIEEYQNEMFDKSGDNKKYLYSLLNDSKLQKFKGPFEQIYFEIDTNGIREELVFEDNLECDLLVGKMSKSELNSEKIIEGIANLEMGFTPCIPQVVIFYCLTSTNALYIYDDRGCDVYSNNREKLKLIYENLNDWILDYDSEEFEEMFK